MKRDPYFAFYPSDWLSSASIAAMTAAQEGAYIRLLCYAWDANGLPSQCDRIAPLARISSDELDVVLEHFPIAGDGKRRNPRQEEERARVSQKRASAAAVASKMWSDRKANAMRSQSDRNAIPEPDTRDQKKKKTPEPSAPPPVVPRAVKPKKDATGPSADAHRHWEAEFQRTRGTAWTWVGQKESVAIAKLVKLEGGLPEVLQRMTRILEASEAWTAAHAAPSLLLSKWNDWAEKRTPVGAVNGVHADALPGYMKPGWVP